MNQIPFLGSIDPEALEELYRKYQTDPQSLDVHWKRFFEGFELAQQPRFQKSVAQEISKDESTEIFRKETAVTKLIEEYRNRGHLFARTNPIRARRVYSPAISIDRFGLTAEDLNSSFHAGKLIHIGYSTLREIIDHLTATYCGYVGCEYTMMQEPVAVDWLGQKIEKTKNQTLFSKDEKKQLLKSVCKAVTFEQFSHARFSGQKRFSLEGLEALIPALSMIVERGADMGFKEIVVGMAHRGRLNVLGNIFQKEFQFIFSEFDAKGYETKDFVGDVKYHLGNSVNIKTRNNKDVHLSMPPNPSHLEAVNPVVAGITRAKLDHRHSDNQDKIVPILIHGDSSIAGQGIIYELMQMANLPAYSLGGTIHIVTNNQIGFTTNFLECRSSIYCTDIAKITNSPVFHVNADNIEAVAHTVLLALEFRHKFHRDVFIDILGYRKHGHNEGDDPNLTQPILYDLIKKHSDAYQIYAKQLIDEGTISDEQNEAIRNEFWEYLDDQLALAKKHKKTPLYSFLKGDWSNIKIALHSQFEKPAITAVSKKKLLSIADKITQLPETHKFIKKIHSIQNTRREAMLKQDKIDWGCAEILAFGSLLLEKYHVRISGEDVLRGTFSQRHTMLRSEDEMLDYYPLKNLSRDQGRFMAYNSLLSEYAVLGFEYGYAMAQPKTLTLWETQFGDFANGAQIIIDQFIAAAETKWQRMNGIVLLLPHGHEGQGPEHSSARIERFLQLCAENNLIVVNPSTPANYFHVLRRQLHSSFRKPLIIFTPKSLLRHPKCVSSFNELSGKSCFQPMIDDCHIDKSKTKKVIFCSGKIFYELNNHRETNKINDTAIVRIEQLYPFPETSFKKVIKSYPDDVKYVWVQEEPENQGALTYFYWNCKLKTDKLSFVSRPAYASTAVGFNKVHLEQQQEIIQKAFANN